MNLIREDVLIIMIMLDWGVVPCNRHPYNIGSSPHVARQLKTIYSEQDMVVSKLRARKTEALVGVLNTCM